MDRKEIFEKLTVIFREVMDNEEIVLEETTCAEDIEEWDSLSYVSFLALCSKVAKTHVEPDEVRNAQTVEDLYRLINR